MNRRIITALMINLLCLGGLSYSLGEQGLASNLEVGQPTQGAWGLVFSVTNNNLGNNYWVDPVSNALSSYSQVGLGAKYYLSPTMRIMTAAEFFSNSWVYANKDTQALWGGALKAEWDFVLLSSGAVNLYAGPVLQVAFAMGEYTSESNANTVAVTGQTYTAGGTVGAEFFPHSQFSIGASCPLVYRLVSTTTDNNTALVGPTVSSVFALGSILLDLTYYF